MFKTYNLTFYSALLDRLLRNVLLVVNWRRVDEHLAAIEKADLNSGQSGAGLIRETYKSFYPNIEPIFVDIPRQLRSGVRIVDGLRRLLAAMEMCIPAFPALDQEQTE